MAPVFKNGNKIRLTLNASNEKRVTSEIQKSFKFLLYRGIIRNMSILRRSTRILTHKLSLTSIVLKLFNSHGRAINEYGLDVNAPTGHKSIILPEISDL